MRGHTAVMGREHQDHATPWEVFHPLHERFRFTVDVCATETNRKVDRFWGFDDRPLERSWVGERWWMNPPYDSLAIWMAKARHEVIQGTRQSTPTLGVHLLPMRPDGWFHRYVLAPAGRLEGSWFCPDSVTFWLAWSQLVVGIHHVPTRIPFERDTNQGNGAPFPSVLVVLSTPGPHPRAQARPRWEGGQGLAPLDWSKP